MSEADALKGTENAGAIWTLLYLVATVELLFRLVDVWFAFHARPSGWKKPIDLGFEILGLPIPLWMGLAFRRTLKDELDKSLLSERTYQICDYWIAQLLLLIYLCFVVVHQ
ncbi:MAG: hypothetical protein ABSD67_06450 [Terracidiphilus sp.]|jgi:uncharacterized membrane protein